MRHALAVALVMLLALPAAGQNLITDGSFENGQVVSCSPGLLPDTWIRILGTPDTFSEDCALSPGAALSIPPGHFVGLGAAHDGVRFVAASNDAAQPDGFGQLLALPLQSARVYRITTQSARSAVSTGNAALDVYLAALPSFAGASFVATLGGDGLQSMWRETSGTFCSPSDAAARPYLLIRPRFGFGNTSYLATDSWELVDTGETCQPPFEAPALGAWGWMLLAMLLGGMGEWSRRRRREPSPR